MSKTIGVNVRRVYRAKSVKVSVKETYAEDGTATGYTVTNVDPANAEQFEVIRAASFPGSTVVDANTFTLPVDAAAPVKVKKVKEPKAPKEPKAAKEPKAGKEKKSKKAPAADAANDGVSEATLEALAGYEQAGDEDLPMVGDVPASLTDFKSKSIIVVEVEDEKYTLVRLSSRVRWEIRTEGQETLVVTPEVAFKTYKGMMNRSGEVKFTSSL